MYAQITTLCNMECPHCAFSCGPSKPFEHMSAETFEKTLDLAERLGDGICIGGGEPTLHPKFWDFLSSAVRTDMEFVWMATNGSRTKDAIMLAKLATHDVDAWYSMVQLAEDEDGEIIDEIVPEQIESTLFNDWEKFSVTLSRDAYHAPISSEVVNTFGAFKHEIRDVTFKLAKVGAAKENQLEFAADHCACETLFVAPNGTVKMCGCPDSLVLGHIDTLLALSNEQLSDLASRIFEVEDEHQACGYFNMTDELAKYVLTGEGYLTKRAA